MPSIFDKLGKVEPCDGRDLLQKLTYVLITEIAEKKAKLDFRGKPESSKGKFTWLLQFKKCCAVFYITLYETCDWDERNNNSV